MGVRVNKPGLLTTVQDLGRFGHQKSGIIVSGAMDTLSIRLANLLVGNKGSDAALEVSLFGPTLTFEVDSVISICGANLSPTLNGVSISLNKPISTRRGDILEFGQPLLGGRCYIAFKGGIGVEPVLASRCTCLPAGFGGFKGRALQKGDFLPITQAKTKNKLNWKLSSYFDSLLFSREPIRILKGIHYDLFDPKSKHVLTSETFTMTKDANRMGFRLEGQPLHLMNQQELLTEGVTFGTVQVPANGHPIILMADRQTTGGYPKIAQIASVDLPRVAQLQMGESISFVMISVDEAQKLLMERENALQALQKVISAKWKVSER
jgi:antagonist of KipI